jgi:hypothetical protein
MGDFGPFSIGDRPILVVVMVALQIAQLGGHDWVGSPWVRLGWVCQGVVASRVTALLLCACPAVE